jgi:hypothetical protein
VNKVLLESLVHSVPQAPREKRGRLGLKVNKVLQESQDQQVLRVIQDLRALLDQRAL